MKKIILSLLLLAGIGAAVGYYLWNKPHQNIAGAKADFSVDAVTLFNDYSSDENASNSRYLNKVIAVSGEVKETSKSENGDIVVVLKSGGDAMFGVSCQLDPLSKHAKTAFAAGEKVTFKGTCSGFNMDVQLARCAEVK